MYIEPRRWPSRCAPAFGRAVFLATLAVALSGCDHTDSGLSGSMAMPTPETPAIAASISQPIAPAPDPFVNRLCFVGSEATSTFDLVITASRTVTLEQVTIQSLGGSFSSGPAVTVTQSTLVSQFGSVVIPAGVTRTFRLQPQVPCGSAQPQSVSVSIVFVETTGARESVTITGWFG